MMHGRFTKRSCNSLFYELLHDQCYYLLPYDMHMYMNLYEACSERGGEMARIPLILLPGTLCNHVMWEEQIEGLEDVACIKTGELLGKSIEAMAGNVLKDAPERFALAGFSMGGIVALEIMKQEPSRVSKLALLNTNPYPPREDQINVWNSYIDMANNGQFTDITQNYLLPKLLHPDSLNNEGLVHTVIQMAEYLGSDIMINQMTALKKRPDGRNVLPAIHCHTVIVVSKEDASCPFALQKTLAKNIMGAALYIMEDCGHMITLEKPQEVNDILREWLKS